MLIIGLAIALALAYLYLKNYYSYFTRHNVPQETPIFFIGNMQGLGKKWHWHQIFERIYWRFKGTSPICGIYQFFSREVMILDPNLSRHILIKDFNKFTDRRLFHNVRDDSLTGNILQLDGYPWRTLRHKLSPVFTSGKIKYMFPSMVKLGDRLADKITTILDSGTNEFEIKDICARFTIDLVGRVAFGLDCNSLKDPDAEFFRICREITDKPRHSLAIQGFMFAMPELARKLRMKISHDHTIKFFNDIVRQTLEYRQENNIQQNDFMDLMLELKTLRDELGENGAADEFSNGLTIEQIAAQAFLFFIAGFDTSSTTMAYCIYELAQNQDIQDKLRSEVNEVLAIHKGELTYEAIKDMSYLNMVISETLRKHSVLPFLSRSATDDYKIPNTDFVIKKYMRVVIPIAAMQKDPEYFPEPEKFDPDRFLPDAIAERNPYVYLPFGEGPRNCIGNRLGKLQAQVGVINMVKKFRFNICGKTQIPMPISLNNFLLSPRGGIFLKCEKI